MKVVTDLMPNAHTALSSIFNFLLNVNVEKSQNSWFCLKNWIYMFMCKRVWSHNILYKI